MSSLASSVPLRVLYLQHLLSVNGRDALLGQRLFDAFKGAAEECLLAHLVLDEPEQAVDPRLAKDLIYTKTVQRLRPNVVYLERGLFDPGGRWRIARGVAEDLIRNGAVLIAADVDINQLNLHRELYDGALPLFKTTLTRQEGEPVALLDRTSNAGGQHEIVCTPEQMPSVADWLRPIYDGIQRIVAGAPAALNATFSDILATGNQDTIKADAEFGAEPSLGAFATVYKYGHGFAVLIAAGVSSDVWVNFAADNTRWLVNVASHLVAHGRENLAREHHLTSGHVLFLSHRSVDKALVARVSQGLQKAAIGTWLDRDVIVAGDSFVSEINRGLETMTAFALFWSATCVNAPWVRLELDAAIALLTDRNIPILIVRLDDTPVPAIVAHLHRIEAEGLTAEEVATALADAITRRAQRGR